MRYCQADIAALQQPTRIERRRSQSIGYSLLICSLLYRPAVITVVLLSFYCRRAGVVLLSSRCCHLYLLLSWCHGVVVLSMILVFQTHLAQTLTYVY